MRRAIFVSFVGLALAFGAFYVFLWPTTLSNNTGDVGLGLDNVQPGELAHFGEFHFTVKGRREITVVTVKLNDPSPGLSLVATHVELTPPGPRTLIVGTGKGPRPDIEALPRAPGLVLHPKDAGHFIMTVQAISPGRYTFNGITVTYETGWLTRSVKVGPRVTVTVPGPAKSPTPRPA